MSPVVAGWGEKLQAVMAAVTPQWGRAVQRRKTAEPASARGG